jgi:hypothetical protein
LPRDGASLFRDGALYTIVVRGFEPTQVSVPALQALRRRSDRVEGAPDAVESTGTATAEMYLAAPGSVGCDARDIVDERRFFQTSHFRFGVKGNMSVGQPKPPHRLRFRKKDERLFGLKTVDLNSMYNDPSHVREALAWTMFREAELPASRFAYVKLCVQRNSPSAGTPRYDYRGLFLMLERPDDVFVKNRFPTKSKGNLYSANMPTARTGATLERRGSAAAYREAVANGDLLPEQTYELDTNNEANDPPELQSYEDLSKFVDTLHGETEALRGLGAHRFASTAYAQALDGIFDTDGFLRWAAINTLLASWDNYLCTPSNFRLYNAGHKPDAAPNFASELMQSPYFHWIPWDYDNSLGVNYFEGAHWVDTPIFEPERACDAYWATVSDRPSPRPSPVLFSNMMKNPGYRQAYAAHVERALATWFNERWVGERIGPDRDIGEVFGGHWGVIRRSVYAETLGGGWEPPFTQRLWTNDEIYAHVHRGARLERQGWGKRDVENLYRFVRRRAERARADLARERQP